MLYPLASKNFSASFMAEKSPVCANVVFMLSPNFPMISASSPRHISVGSYQLNSSFHPARRVGRSPHRAYI
jgi:hypothetical protein